MANSKLSTSDKSYLKHIRNTTREDYRKKFEQNDSYSQIDLMNKIKKEVKKLMYIMNIRSIIIFITIMLIIIFLADRYRRLFFLFFFILANWFILYLKMGFGIKSPISIITVGTFLCGYIYGIQEALILSVSSLIAITITARINLHKIVINIMLFIVAFISPELAFQNIVTGMLISQAIVLFGHFGYLIVVEKNFYGIIYGLPILLIDQMFWLIIFSSYGNLIIKLMSV